MGCRVNVCHLSCDWYTLIHSNLCTPAQPKEAVVTARKELGLCDGKADTTLEHHKGNTASSRTSASVLPASLLTGPRPRHGCSSSRSALWVRRASSCSNSSTPLRSFSHRGIFCIFGSLFCFTASPRAFMPVASSFVSLRSSSCRDGNPG